MRVRLRFSVGLIVFLIGCGSVRLPYADGDLVPVSGTVTYKGKPLADARVTFSPQGGNTKAAVCQAKTDDKGKYELISAGSKTGAVPGQYKVCVSKKRFPGAKSAPAPVAEPTTQPNTIAPEVEPPGGEETLPEHLSSITKSQIVVTVPDKGGAVNIDLK